MPEAKLVEKELARDVGAFGVKKEPKSAGDIVKVPQHVIDSNPGLFLEPGEGKRRLKNSGDTSKLKARISELESQNKALLIENKKLKAAK